MLEIYDSSYVLRPSSFVCNSFMYTGREYDSETGLYYYRMRYYDASVGRFITADPIGIEAGVNLYGYTNGNPVLYIDPFGLKQWAPWWVEIFAPGYEFYGGPFRTDPTFQIPPADSMDELFREHDRGWANDQCSLADKNLLSGLGSLSMNPYRWKRKPKNILGSILYHNLATAYFFWFSK